MTGTVRAPPASEQLNNASRLGTVGRVPAPISQRIRRSATRLLGRQWDLPMLGRVTVVGPTTESLALIDQLWPDARHPSHVHGGWRWGAISKACEDHFVIVSDGGDPQEPIAIWGSKSASTITLEGRSYYRLDFIEVRPDLRGELPMAATFALATVAMRARERRATGIVLAAFNIAGVGRAYEARGAVRGCPKGWSCPSDLVPYTFEEPALDRLERETNELETTKAK